MQLSARDQVDPGDTGSQFVQLPRRMARRAGVVAVSSEHRGLTRVCAGRAMYKLVFVRRVEHDTMGQARGLRIAAGVAKA